MKAQQIKVMLISEILKLDLESEELHDAYFNYKTTRPVIALAEIYVFCKEYENYSLDTKNYYKKDILVMAVVKSKAQALIKKIKKVNGEIPILNFPLFHRG